MTPPPGLPLVRQVGPRPRITAHGVGEVAHLLVERVGVGRFVVTGVAAHEGTYAMAVTETGEQVLEALVLPRACSALEAARLGWAALAEVLASPPA